MRLSLVVLTAGQQAGRQVAITRSQFLIGRDPGCHLRTASPLVSDRHCALLQRAGVPSVRALGDDTLLNGKAVKGEAQLRDGDQLQIGPLLFKVQLECAPAPVTAAGPVNRTGSQVKAEREDDIAAMLLSLPDDKAGPQALATSVEVSTSTTGSELPAPPPPVKDSRAGTAEAAKKLLDQMRRRPRT
jgi:predicted component of type VI protein secretion system